MERSDIGVSFPMRSRRSSGEVEGVATKQSACGAASWPTRGEVSPEGESEIASSEELPLAMTEWRRSLG